MSPERIIVKRRHFSNLFPEVLEADYFTFFNLNLNLNINFFSHYIQHCFICRPSDSTVPTDAGIEPKTVATDALAV